MANLVDLPPALPDPRGFDPVRFPGTVGAGRLAPGALRLPLALDARARPAFRARFQRRHLPDARLRALRILLDIERAHLLLDIAPEHPDFLLLRLVPAALRLARHIPGRPRARRAAQRRPTLPEAHHLYAATAALVDGLSRAAGEAGVALSEALSASRPGPR